MKRMRASEHLSKLLAGVPGVRVRGGASAATATVWRDGDAYVITMARVGRMR